MTYLLALIAVAGVAVLCWKAFGSAGPTPLNRNRIIGPDDDSEFLWRISRQRRDNDSGTTDR